MDIHPTAIIDKTVELGENVEVGAYAIIKGKVRIGDNTKIGEHAYIQGITEIGKNNKIYPFASIGSDPQDLKYNEEPTKLIIGDNNIFREFVTINRGTVGGQGITKIGNNNLFMAYSHVAHDCDVKNYVILANNATLAGHITVENYAIIGGLSAVHQFCKIGEYAMIAGKTGVAKDIPPFMLASGQRAKLYGPNLIGLRRHGFSEERIKIIRKVYNLLFKRKEGFRETCEMLEREYSNNDDVMKILNFIKNSERGITKG